MFRNLMIGTVAAVAVGFGARAVTAGEAVVVVPGGPATGFYPPCGECEFIVSVKRHHHGHWEFYGRFESLHAARHAERRLERDGFLVRIEEVRTRR